MANIFGRLPLAFKYVAEVGVTIGTDDFGTLHPQRTVSVADDRAGYFIVKRRPAAAAVELVRRLVQWMVATAASKSTRRVVIVVLAGKSPFGAFMDDDSFLLGREGIPIFAGILHLDRACRW